MAPSCACGAEAADRAWANSLSSSATRPCNRLRSLHIWLFFWASALNLNDEKKKGRQQVYVVGLLVVFAIWCFNMFSCLTLLKISVL